MIRSLKTIVFIVIIPDSIQIINVAQTAVVFKIHSAYTISTISTRSSLPTFNINFSSILTLK